MDRWGTPALAAVAATFGMALSTASSGTAGAEEPGNWLDDTEVTSTAYATLVGGDYYYEASSIGFPAPALVYGVPDALSQDVGAQPVEVTYHWGDGSPDSVVRSDADPETDHTVSFACWSCEYQVDDGTEPPTYLPQDGFALSGSTGAGHVYERQGMFGLYLTGTQPQGDGSTSTVQGSRFTQLVVDLAKGGTLSGEGRVRAPAGSGGMYDTDFAGGPVTFRVTAGRRSGQAATTVHLTVKVPSMTPDWPPTDPPTGLTFHATAGLAPMFVTDTRTRDRVFLRMVEGQVTNSNGRAGTARATLHALMRKGQPTVLRIQLQNASAGYTYLDTGYQRDDYSALDKTHDLLRSGSLTVG